MNLGEFRTLTAGVPDTTDIYICQALDDNVDESLAVGVYVDEDEILIYDA